MNPEKDWAEKAVEEIMREVLIAPLAHPGYMSNGAVFGYAPEFAPRAVEIIKRHARESLKIMAEKVGLDPENATGIFIGEEALITRAPMLSDRELVMGLASTEELDNLADRIASKLAPKTVEIHAVEGELKAGPLNELMKKVAANVQRDAYKEISPKTESFERWGLFILGICLGVLFTLLAKGLTP